MEYSQSEEALQLSHLTNTSLTATVSRSTLSSDQIQDASFEDDEGLLTAQSGHSRPRAYRRLQQFNEAPTDNKFHGQKKSVRAIGFAQTLALFWLLPIVALIVLNLRGLVIGASAWCPQGRCYSDNYNTTLERGHFEKTRASLEMSSRNLLGALQLAAKVLEMWFTLITTSLVYMLTSKLAKDGLPVKYILRPSEFTEISGFFDTALWRSAFMNHDRHRIRRSCHKKLPDLTLSVFLLATIILCILCNLMDPAVAVLIIRSQQWYPVEVQGHNTFVYMKGAQPPTKPFSNNFSCNTSFAEVQNYSCATKWAAEFDQSIAYVSESSLFEHHERLSFMIFNESLSDSNELTLWAANRGTLEALSEDVELLRYATRIIGVSNATRTLLEMNHDWLASCSRSLQTSLRRTGPVLGAQISAWAGNSSMQAWTTVIDDARSIRCYPGYPISSDICEDECWTKCITIGPGWNDGNKTAAFSLGRENQSAQVHLAIHASGQTAYLRRDEVSQNADGCLVNGTIDQNVNCDWEAFFKPRTTDDNTFYNSYKFLNTLEITPMVGSPYLSLALDFVGLLTFAEYELNPSLYDNPLLFTTISSAQYEQRNYTITPTKIDPSWFLATWSANPGSIVSDRIPSDKVLNAFDQLAELSDRNHIDREDMWDIGYDDGIQVIIVLSLIQMLSWMNYETTNSSSSKADIDHPFTGLRPQIFTWAYGMKAHPRSEVLAIIVAMSGCVVVLIQCAVAVLYRDKYWSTSQLLAAALRYSYQKEFDGIRDKDVGQVSFKLRSDDSSAVGFKFTKAD
ncbi:hypothetical protein HII31_12545 [Pseudocercospora fuligena]|uniref:Uncharacterized protein n=1 Tax=Pseudocercospora fuligena TaxID=685502 RepID=A0A8H6VCF2_9PEZI|nr:hypothetical protein HII31_12545 [Pseudocercospora fuligena]